MRKVTITAFSLLLPPPTTKKEKKNSSMTMHHATSMSRFPDFIYRKSNKKQSAYFISTTQLGTQCWYLGALVSQAAVPYI